MSALESQEQGEAAQMRTGRSMLRQALDAAHAGAARAGDEMRARLDAHRVDLVEDLGQLGHAVSISAEALHAEGRETTARLADRLVMALHRASRWMSGHPVESIACDLEGQARRHPVLFATGFLALGFGAVRVLRSAGARVGAARSGKAEPLIVSPAMPPQGRGRWIDRAGTPSRLALSSLGAGALVGGALALTQWELETFAGVRETLAETARRSLDEWIEIVRAALSPVDAARATKGAAEQPPAPFADMPREFPYEEPVSMLRRISVSERILEEEEPTVDLRNDIVGDEHPF